MGDSQDDPKTRISVVTGNIVKQPDCDAIVNSANESLRAGSGVCGAIHSAAGRELEAFSTQFAPLGLAQAVITPGFRLANPWIIHVKGPKYLFDPNPALALEECMHNVIHLAAREGIERIAVPAISTGVYGYPMDEAIPILVASSAAALRTCDLIRELRFVVTSPDVARMFQASIEGRTVSAGVISRRLLDTIREHFRLNWKGIHGIEHWSRVRLNGLDLARTTGADPVVVELFSVLHDSCRRRDGRDPEHGIRAAGFVAELQGREIFISRSQLSVLQEACAGHTSGQFHDDMTIATCWDADRLDLWRLGIRPDPERLLTDAAKQPAVIAKAKRHFED